MRLNHLTIHIEKYLLNITFGVKDQDKVRMTKLFVTTISHVLYVVQDLSIFSILLQRSNIEKELQDLQERRQSTEKV